jgi:membrane protein implicated in regulation of membrane protease activity
VSVPIIALLLLSCACASMSGRSKFYPGRAALWAAAVAVCLACAAAIDVMDGQWPAAGIVLAGVAYWLWQIWRHWRRRKRRRSLKALGHKARARLAAMARNMPRPSPAPRLVPQGARA